MKKIVLALSGIVLIQLAQAQVAKGSLFIGGSASFSNSKTESGNSTAKTNMWAALPQVGVAIQQNKVVGIQLHVSGSATERVDLTSKTSSNGYGAGVFYRQYFPLANKWMLYGQANVLAIFSHSKTVAQGVTTDKGKAWQAEFGITPGISFQAGKKLWLEASLSDLFSVNYTHSKADALNPSGAVINTSTQNNFTASANASGFNSIAVGIRWIIPKA